MDLLKEDVKETSEFSDVDVEVNTDDITENLDFVVDNPGDIVENSSNVEDNLDTSKSSKDLDSIFKVIYHPEDVNAVKGLDPARTIIVMEYNSELIEAFRLVGFFYIVICDKGNEDSIADNLDTLKSNLSKHIDELYEIDTSNFKYKQVLEQEGLGTAVEQFDSLINSISTMNKEAFVQVAKYSIKNLIKTRDKMKRLINLINDDEYYETKYNKVKLEVIDLKKNISALEIKNSKLSKATETLTAIPELQEQLRESEKTIQDLYSEISALKATNGSKSSDLAEITNLKGEIAQLKSQLQELTVKNDEYKKELSKSSNTADTNKDIIIQELRNQIKQMTSNKVKNTENIADLLPILIPDKLVLNNATKFVYLKEISEFIYLDCIMEYLRYTSLKRSNMCVIILDTCTNEFHNKMYNSLGYFEDGSPIHIVSDLNLITIKHFGIQSCSTIIIIDRLGLDKLAVMDYAGLETYFLVNYPEEVTDYKLDASKCVGSFNSDDIAYSLIIPENALNSNRKIRMFNLRDTKFIKRLTT